MSFFSLQNLRSRWNRILSSRRREADLLSPPNQPQENNSCCETIFYSRKREDFSRDLSSVRMRRRLPLLESADRDNSRRQGVVYEDFPYPMEEPMENDNNKLETNNQLLRTRLRRQSRRLEDMNNDEDNFSLDMNELRKEMTVTMNQIFIPSFRPFRMELDIPFVSSCKHTMFMHGRMTPEDHRLKDKCNAGMIKASMENDLASLKYFVYGGANIFNSDGDGWTALHIAASKGFTEVADFLISERLYRDCQTHKGETPLMLAARANHLSTVQLLLRNEASADVTDVQGRTPLMHAAQSAGKEILKVLTENKSNLNVIDKEGNTALIWATMHKNDAAVDYLVNTFYELDLEKKTHGKNWTALHWAVSTASETNIRALVIAGAALNACHINKGETPVKLADRLGNREIRRLMHSLEACSHRRVAYCSDGEEFKYFCFILGQPLEGDLPRPPLSELSSNTLNLYRLIQEELRKQEDAEQENHRRQLAESEPTDSEDTISHGAAGEDSSDGTSKTTSVEGETKQNKGDKSQTKGVSKASKRRKQIQERRRLVRRKLDPIMAACADDIRNAADNSAVKDEIYPPPLKIKIHVFTLIFLYLKTENIQIQNMSCVEVVGTDAVPPAKKPSRHG